MDEIDEINETGSTSRSNIRTFTVIGQIEGHYMLGEGQKSTKYEHIIPLLADAEQDNDTKGLLFLINTMGGDVEAGLAIAEMISGMSKPTTSVVLGGGHSIGVPLAVAAKRSFIVPSATMTLHPVRLNGTVIGVPQTYNYLQRMQDRITGFIAAHSKINIDELRRLMMNTDELANDVGTIIDGNAAVSCGLIDEIGGVSDAVKYLRGTMTGE
ncbi:MAG: ATP-dependent Clp protease proteolytic subunit [Firmicutes bacterium]|nr:ATP-dependent Clp protease proteolytic subunit [Bacillota bacterium]MCD7783223.1 ATP-dependent Clp protease proteolytic subunit [Bacillota bacterium]MCD7788022.1 ATP-dependent Clp protease proteolytic subunit [Bacillota bacterium]MCD7831965.1 ATP-dependent Clp protease proteolytic subunit [Bacillota bacterium]MCD8311472.1 ATP-dependent Clp protease proteolytic subunit [Bacillota bacterium]